LALLYALTVHAFYVMALGGIGAPFLAKEFGFDDAAITRIAGWISLGAFGTPILTRLADRYGRRRILVLSFAGLAPFCTASAFATDVPSYVVAQIVVGALLGTFATALAVAVAEEAPDAQRATAQAYFGVFAAFGGALSLLLSTLEPWLWGGWRSFWIVAALPIVAVPFVRARLLETARFDAARDSGRVARTRARDLFAAPHRRRAFGLLAVGLLKPMSLNAVGTWPFYHMVKTLGLEPGWASLVYVVGGGIGILGNALGARLTDRWGRRPTSLASTSLAVLAGCAFFFVPRGATVAAVLPALMVLMAVTQIATSVYSVADRCIDAELFPTALRATYLGAARLMNAGAGVVSMFALSALAGPLGGLPSAIAVLSAATLLPALAIFLAVVPETRGLTLEHASLEDVA
jgi:MFS transporter, putative metabolite:H+ symporter